MHTKMGAMPAMSTNHALDKRTLLYTYVDLITISIRYHEWYHAIANFCAFPRVDDKIFEKSMLKFCLFETEMRLLFSLFS